jgi:predicted RNA-binding Zn ribbon-like protein
VTDAALVVALANARAVMRPTHARSAAAHDALKDAASASALLGELVDERRLDVVRALQRSVAAIVDALIDGSRAPLEDLNALAAREPAIHALVQEPDGRLRAEPRHASVTARIVATVLRELGELDPARLRRCGRPECRLVFYDTTRSGTQRWHADRPCGLRERQRRHRARRAA